jgi:hypothetical protein
MGIAQQSFTESIFLHASTITFITQNFPGTYDLLPRFNFVQLNQGYCESFQTSFGRLSNQRLVNTADDLYGNQLAGPGRVASSFGINGTAHRSLRVLDFTDPTCPRALGDPTGDGTVPSLSSGMFLDPTAYSYVLEEHRALPGNPSVQQKILNILKGQHNVPVPGIWTSLVSASDGWSWSSCSPIRTQIVDSAGKMNGIDSDGDLHEEIADSRQFRFPENEGGFVPFENTYAVTVDGTDNALFTLRFDHVVGPNDSTVGSIVYTGVPVSTKSHGHLTLSPTDAAPSLSLDVDGDGTTDFIVGANSPPAPNLFVAVLSNVVRNFSLKASVTKSLLAKLDAAAASLARGNRKAARGQMVLFLAEVDAQRGKALTTAQADTLTTLGKAALAAM